MVLKQGAGHQTGLFHGRVQGEGYVFRVSGIELGLKKMSNTINTQTQDWLNLLTDVELAHWEAKSQSEKDWYLEHTQPENRKGIFQTELKGLEYHKALNSMPKWKRERILKEAERKANEAKVRIIQRFLQVEGLNNRICCNLRSDERYIEVLGRDRIEVCFYWKKGYWTYLQDGSMQKVSGDVDDLIRFMKSMDWIPEMPPKKGQMGFWD